MIEELHGELLRPLLLSCSDAAGGAARAAFRLHRSLIGAGVPSHMLVGVKASDWDAVEGPRSLMGRSVAALRAVVGVAGVRLQKTNNQVLHSLNFLPSYYHRRRSVLTKDVVHLHWVGNEFLSVGDIGRIMQPVVWTMHDMWPFCGAEHYAPDDGSARWRVGYRHTNRQMGDRGIDLDRWTWARKRAAWKRPIRLVAPSRWLAECAQQSALMHDWPVSVVPNVLDTAHFRPWPKALSRQMLNLPVDRKLILFGAMGGGHDPRKGWDLLQDALRQIAPAMQDAAGVIFGQSEPLRVPELGMPLHWLGPLHDDVTLSLAYSAADVMVVPSRQENLPQTGTEAQSCGCPVVAFDCTGLPDVVDHGSTGYLATAYDPADLAQGIRWVLEDPERYLALSTAARNRAVRLWDSSIVVPQYLDVYRQAIADWNRSGK